MGRKRKQAPPAGINLVVFALLCFVTLFLGMDWGLHRGNAPSAPALRGVGEHAFASPVEARDARVPRGFVDGGAQAVVARREPPGFGQVDRVGDRRGKGDAARREERNGAQHCGAGLRERERASKNQANNNGCAQP